MIMFLAAAFRGIWTHLNWKWVPQPHPGCNGSGGEAWEVTRQKSETSVVKKPACGGSYGGNQEPHRLWHRHQFTIQTTLRLQKKSISHDRPVSKFSLLPSAETPVRESTRAMPHVHMYTHVWSCTCMRAYISVQYLHVPYMQAYMICSALSNSGSLQWASSVEKWKVPADHLRCTSSKVQRQGQNQNVFHVGVRQPLPGSAEHLRTQSRLPARFSDSCLANFNQNPMVQTLLPLVRAWLWLPLVTSLTYRFQHVFACCTQALYHHRGICTTGKQTSANKHARKPCIRLLWGSSHPEINLWSSCCFTAMKGLSVTALDVCDPNLHQHPFHRRYKAHFFECYFAASWHLLPASKNPSESCGTLLPEGVGQFVPRWLCSSR